jgi:hypothetical protein
VPHNECLKSSSEQWGNSQSGEKYGEIGAGLAITAGVFLILASFCSVLKCNGFGREHMKKRFKYQDNYD